MGVGFSGRRLARTVSRRGQLGVVPSVGIDALLERRLQDGDPDGHLRRAMAHFPIPEVSAAVLISPHFGSRADAAVLAHRDRARLPAAARALAGCFHEKVRSVKADLAVMAYLWAAKSGQFDDLETPRHSVLWEEDAVKPESDVKREESTSRRHE